MDTTVRERHPAPPHDAAIARSIRVLDVVVACVLIVWASERPVLAYIDPGSGALVWQAIMAGFFGLVFYFRKFVSRIVKRKDTRSTGSGSE